MTITIVCDVLGAPNNGTTLAAMNLTSYLRSRGHTVRIVCSDQDRRGEKDMYVVPVRNMWPINRYIAKNDVALALPDASVVESALEGCDLVHVMIGFPLARMAAKMATEKGIPVTGGFHAMAENLSAHIFMKQSALANRLTYRYYSLTYRYCTAIHYPTRFLRGFYEDVVGPTNGYVISNGVDSDFHPRSATRPEAWKDRDVVLFTGRYSPEKSHRLLIEAAKRSTHRDRLQLVFAGQGPLREKMEKWCADLPVKPVFGFHSRSEMVDIINMADLYVHPAEIEAEGIACLEAIACGLVPVISDSPRCATRTYALDEKNLFDHKSPEDLARKMDWWLEHPEERAKRGQEYLAMARGELDRAVCMERMEQMMFEAAGKEALTQIPAAG